MFNNNNWFSSMNNNLSWMEKMDILDNIDRQHLKIMPKFIGPVLPHKFVSIPHFPNYLEVRDKHLFAKVNIPDGHIIAVTSYDNLNHKKWCINTPLGNFFNHSYDPNTSIRSNKKGEIKIVATRNINKGETLTINYQ